MADSTYNVQCAMQQLESIVDEHGLAQTIEMLAEICNLKADHIRSNWQDESLACLWGRMSGKLQRDSDEAFKFNGLHK